MLEILGYFGYTLLGFGLGGLVYKRADAKIILKEFNIFKKKSENEISQINQGKEKQLNDVQSLTKENVEIKKQYNRSVQTIELNRLELLDIKAKLKEKTSKKTEKNTLQIVDADELDNYFN